MVRGEIIDKDETSITVKLPDGSSKILLISTNTSISKVSQGSRDDFKKGELVLALGSENSDGSVTAQEIQLGRQLQGSPF